MIYYKTILSYHCPILICFLKYPHNLEFVMDISREMRKWDRVASTSAIKAPIAIGMILGRDVVAMPMEGSLQKSSRKAEWMIISRHSKCTAHLDRVMSCPTAPWNPVGPGAHQSGLKCFDRGWDIKSDPACIPSLACAYRMLSYCCFTLQIFWRMKGFRVNSMRIAETAYRPQTYVCMLRYLCFAQRRILDIWTFEFRSNEVRIGGGTLH